MATGAGRRRVIGAAVALVAIVSAVVIGLSVAGSGGGRSPAAGTAPVVAPTAPIGAPTAGATPPTTSGAPSAQDVAAARACQAFAVYLDDASNGHVPAAAGRTLIEDAATLLQGATKDQASGRSLPPWSTLGSELLAAAEDVVAHRSAALRTDGAAAGAQCRTVPAAAAKAGGFVRNT